VVSSHPRASSPSSRKGTCHALPSRPAAAAAARPGAAAAASHRVSLAPSLLLPVLRSKTASGSALEDCSPFCAGRWWEDPGVHRVGHAEGPELEVREVKGKGDASRVVRGHRRRRAQPQEQGGFALAQHDPLVDPRVRALLRGRVSAREEGRDASN